MVDGGIYQIVCLKNGKTYVGSAELFERRFSQHINDLRIGSHSNKHLQRAFNKYGEESFEIEVLKSVNRGELSQLEYRVVLLKYEQFYIDAFDSYKVGLIEHPKLVVDLELS